jgi:hypothetical protein
MYPLFAHEDEMCAVPFPQFHWYDFFFPFRGKISQKEKKVKKIYIHSEHDQNLETI